VVHAFAQNRLRHLPQAIFIKLLNINRLSNTKLDFKDGNQR
jgi:hypothetical protein